MISILIPIYNFDVEKLTAAVMRQCQKEKIEYEVLCYDDQSEEKYKAKNSFLSGVFRVNYLELKENLGRAKIRNWLSKSARFDHLLFLDCDSKIVRKDFIKKYISNRHKADVINGGRIYSKKPPKANSKILHWKYGRKRESKSPKTRNSHTITYFHSNNFLIKRKVALAHPFDEAITGYGYEDLFFAENLVKEGRSILHIDNPVEHLGIEKNTNFIEKNLNAVKTLAKYGSASKKFVTRLQKWHGLLEEWHIKNFALSYYARNEKSILENLKSKKPNLWFFDLCRLYHYDDLLNKKEM